MKSSLELNLVLINNLYLKKPLGIPYLKTKKWLHLYYGKQICIHGQFEN